MRLFPTRYAANHFVLILFMAEHSVLTGNWGANLFITPLSDIQNVFSILLINFTSAILKRLVFFINLARPTIKSKIWTFGPFVLSNIQEGNSVGPETKELSDLFDKKKLGL